MGLGFFMIFLTICGAGVFAFLFFSFAGFIWKKEKKNGIGSYVVWMKQLYSI